MELQLAIWHHNVSFAFPLSLVHCQRTIGAFGSSSLAQQFLSQICSFKHSLERLFCITQMALAWSHGLEYGSSMAHLIYL